MAERALLCLWAALLCAGAGVARANYSLPGAAPYARPQPFRPFARPPLAQPPQTRRAPYSSPAYLPPGPPGPSDYRQGYEGGYYDGRGQDAGAPDSVRTNINNEYYERGAAAAPPAEERGYGPPAPSEPPAQSQEFPGRPGGAYTRVQGGQGRAQLHAVLDYDDDYYEDDDAGSSPADGVGDGGRRAQAVTPIQGPIFLKNGTVPVVPLYSYPVLNNGSFVQIPILWSALSVALGLEVRGQLIRGVPCVKRFHQLFCPTAGNTYPIDRIEHFIDENKALMKRMYGDFTVFTEYGLPRRNKRGAPGVPDPMAADPEVREPWVRHARQAQTTRARPSPTPSTPPFLNPNQGNSSGRIDACESKMEIVTPYWALNSAGKVRAVVNTMHFEQAIHQEVCSKTQTNRCAGDCGCEQKYKWHRLLAYDPDQDCAGIFMDWFLFPSCCVCRCQP